YVWIDEAEIKLGDSLIEKITEGIDSVDYVGVVLSPKSVQSEWVKREVDVAMNQEIKGRRVKVLPLLYEQCELPGFLAGKLYADFTNPFEYHVAFAKILQRLGITTTSSDPNEALLKEISGSWTAEWTHGESARRGVLEINNESGGQPTAAMTISYHKQGA